MSFFNKFSALMYRLCQAISFEKLPQLHPFAEPGLAADADLPHMKDGGFPTIRCFSYIGSL